MRRKKTTADFIAQARTVHGNRYDYSRVNYCGNKSKVVVVCSTHGPWEQTPANHLSGFGCKLCGFGNAGQYHKKDTKKFISAARKVHGDRYDCSSTRYVGAREKVTIICPTHGRFEQQASDHLAGAECLQCSYTSRGERGRMTCDEFCRRATEIHRGKYSYDLARNTYTTTQTKITIVCPEHGPFEQTPSGHLAGRGCPVCWHISAGDTMRKSKQNFIADAREVHGDLYDYSNAEYSGANTPVQIICPTDGPFMQTPSSHLSGTGCPLCSRRNQGAPRNLVRALRGEFDTIKEAFVYVVEFRIPTCTSPLYKVGSGSGGRLLSVVNSIRKIGGVIGNVSSRVFLTPAEAIVYEHIAQEQIRDHKYPIPKDLKFPGYSEVFGIAPQFESVECHQTLTRFRAGDRWDPRAE